MRNHACRAKHEAALAHFGVRDDQIIAHKDAAAPQDDIQIKRARPPALPPALCASAPESALYALQAGEHIFGAKIACNESCRIGIAPQRRANRCAFDNRRGDEHIKALSLDCGKRGLYHTARIANARHTHIGSQSDQVCVLHGAQAGQISCAIRPYSCGRRSRKKPMPARCVAARARSSVATRKPASPAPNSLIISPHSSQMKECP